MITEVIMLKIGACAGIIIGYCAFNIMTEISQMLEQKRLFDGRFSEREIQKFLYMKKNITW